MTAQVLFSGVAFLVYGILCVFTDSMKLEFDRFGLRRFRIFTGVLEILGGLGLLVGYWWLPAMLIASGGLTLLMLLGVGVRIWIKDSLMDATPALVLMVLNLHIFWAHWPR